jgi:uncharacterized repeat protein (TIGR01451 family)
MKKFHLLSWVLFAGVVGTLQGEDRKAGSVRQASAFALKPPSALVEGGAVGALTFVRSGSVESSILLRLRSMPPGALAHPQSVLVAAGTKRIKIPVRATDNRLLDLTRDVQVFAFQNDLVLASAIVPVRDDEAPPVMELKLPGQIQEGKGRAYGRILIDRPALSDFKIQLSANPASEVGLTREITMKAGRRSAGFQIEALDDPVIDGSRNVRITATASHGILETRKTITALDNEQRVLSIQAPVEIPEGGEALASVSVGSVLRSRLEIALKTSDAQSLVLPGKVVIPAGESSVTFGISSPSNADPQLDRPVSLSAAAPSFQESSLSLVVLDRSLASLRLSQVPESLKAGRSFIVKIQGLNKSGAGLDSASGTLNMELLLPGGKTMVLPNANAAPDGSFWSAEVQVPNDVVGIVKLRATHPDGLVGESQEFEILAPDTAVPYAELAQATNDIIWDPLRKRIYASVPATGGTHANRVVVIEPASREIIGSVFVGQEPAQLALTSDGSALYVARNGNGTISRIDLPALTVGLTFPVGTSNNYGTLYAEDICTVEGQPNLLVVSQYRKSVSPRHNGVAVFDNGVARTAVTQDHTGSNRIEPSGDPTLFYGYNNETTEYGVRHLRLSASGMTQEQNNRDLIGGFSTDIKADGNLLVATSGVVVDGAGLRKLGTLGTQGLVRPELAKSRVYVLGQSGSYSSTYNKITAYDSVLFSSIRQYTLPTAVESPSSLIRWGDSGLAFRSASKVFLVHDNRLVPSGPPADLETLVEASVNPASVGQPFEYRVKVRNNGPNPAFGTLITASLSANQTIGTVSSSVGTPTKPTATTIALAAGTLSPGGEITLTIPATPGSAGSISCTAGASSEVTDPNQSNNSAFKLVSVGFQSGPDSVNTLRLASNNLIYDSGRVLLWAAIPGTVDAPLGKSIVSIDPVTGLISDPLPLGAEPYANSMALSGNGRYLYLGLSDVPEVVRIDLNSAAKTLVRIPLGASQWGGANYAQDIEVLDGDGTSFLIAGSGDHAAAAYDGSVRRTSRTGIYSVDRVEPSGQPGIYIGYNNYTSGFDLTRLQVDAGGVSEILNRGNVVSGYYVDIEGDGGWLLSSNGRLIDAATLTLQANLGVSGRPCLDAANQRAYLVNGNQLRAFNLSNGEAAGNLALPTTSTGDWAKGCIRWGSDGFAVMGPESILIARWSQAVRSSSIPAPIVAAAAVTPADIEDSDGDGMADGLEWLLGTPADRVSANPITLAGLPGGDRHILSVVFPRRAGISPGTYGFEVSQDLRNWTAAEGVVETVVASEMTDGVLIERVNAAVPVKPSPSNFVRIRWNP